MGGGSMPTFANHENLHFDIEYNIHMSSET